MYIFTTQDALQEDDRVKISVAFLFFKRDALRADCVYNSAGYLFFFFMVATNLDINLFIKLGLNSALSKKGFIVLIVFNKNGSIKIHYRRIYHEGGDPLIPTCVTSATIWGLEKQGFL